MDVAADTLLRFLQRGQTEDKMLRDENTQILHRLQTLQTKASIARLSLFSFSSLEKTKKSLLPLHQVLICSTHVLPQLCQF